MILILPISLFVFGAVLGAAANYLIYGQRIEVRPISPWMHHGDSRGADCQSANNLGQVGNLPHVGKRHWSDYLPIFGWLGMRRNAPIFGTGFWIRPLLVELLMGLGVAALYQYEMQGGLLPAGFPRPNFMLHTQFAAHVILIFWMTVASLIDADEMIIPDSVTMKGTILGLILAAFCPTSLLPDAFVNAAGVPVVDFLRVTSPSSLTAWPGWFDDFGGLHLGVGCWLLWCFALLPRTWYSRHGFLRACQLCCARIRREQYSVLMLILAIVGSVAIAVCWIHGGRNWAGLISALVGMAAGGGIVWAVRILGSAAMKREAMGFGDVTLMAMIGTFLGWQPALIVFFLAPFAALVVGVFRLLLSQEREIPYGPFLCLATLAVIYYWEPIWDRTLGIFALGWILPLVLAGCFALLPILLYGLRWTGLFGRGE